MGWLQRTRRILPLLVVAAAACGACAPGPPPELRVVLITVDTLRHDCLDEMPNLRARAADATRFSRFYAATSTTQPSHASMFTGLHPWQHGVTRNGHILSDQHMTLAEHLSSAGFGTHAIVGSFPVAARFGFGQGFQRYNDDFSQNFYGVARWSGEDVPDLEFYSLADRVTDQAIREIERADESRQFFWIHYFDPHAPYGSSQGGELSAREIRAAAVAGDPSVATLLDEARTLYAVDLGFLDRELERLLARLDESGVETHVMLVADHGESFGEDGSIAHSYRLIDSQIRVPALVWSPRLQPGERRDVAGSIDVTRTLLSLAGVAAAVPGGRDMTVVGPSAQHAYGMRQTFKDGSEAAEEKLNGEIVPLDGLLFYAVGSDGRIRRGNSEGLRDEAARELMELFLRFAVALGGRETAEIPTEVERALERLGYLQ
jgi:arylsulfatase A-like enzyme